MALTDLGVKSYARIASALPLPGLVEVQLQSYEWLRTDGLYELFDEVSPINSFNGLLSLYLPGKKAEEAGFELGYRFGEPKHDQHECLDRDLTYAVPLSVDVALVNRETSEIVQQEIFLGDLPFLGRLFRSRSEQSVKRNLLVFVTARLVDPAGRVVRTGGESPLLAGGAEGRTPAPVAEVGAQPDAAIQ